MHLITDDKGRHFDLDDMLGSYDYVMAFLVDNGAPNMVLSCLQRIAPMRGRYDMKNTKTRRTAKARSGSLKRVVSLGDYVLATKYSDCGPGDPWRVGFVVRIIRDKRGETYIIGEQDGTWSDFREYKHAKQITADEGKAWLKANA